MIVPALLRFPNAPQMKPVSVAQSPLYLVGTYSAGVLTLDSAMMFAFAEPSSEDGKVYMLIGTTRSTYEYNFHPTGGLFAYYDGAFQPWSPVSSSSGSGGGSGATPAPALMSSAISPALAGGGSPGSGLDLIPGMTGDSIFPPQSDKTQTIMEA